MTGLAWLGLARPARAGSPARLAEATMSMPRRTAGLTAAGSAGGRVLFLPLLFRDGNPATPTHTSTFTSTRTMTQTSTQTPTITFTVTHTPTFTSTVTNTFTPTTGICGLVNCDFEAGFTVGWTEYSSHFWGIILSSEYLAIPPHSGDWAAWLGGDANETASIEQAVTVPVGAPYLAYYQWIDSEEPDCNNDTATVIVDGALVQKYGLCGNSSTGGWIIHYANLSAYAGQTVDLLIQVETNAADNSNLYIDDVSFAVSEPSSPPPGSGARVTNAAAFVKAGLRHAYPLRRR